MIKIALGIAKFCIANPLPPYPSKSPLSRPPFFLFWGLWSADGRVVGGSAAGVGGEDREKTTCRIADGRQVGDDKVAISVVGSLVVGI